MPVLLLREVFALPGAVLKSKLVLGRLVLVDLRLQRLLHRVALLNALLTFLNLQAVLLAVGQLVQSSPKQARVANNLKKRHENGENWLEKYAKLK